MAQQTNLEQAETHMWEMIRRLAPILVHDSLIMDLDELEIDAGLLGRAVENLLLTRKLRVMRKLSESD